MYRQSETHEASPSRNLVTQLADKYNGEGRDDCPDIKHINKIFCIRNCVRFRICTGAELSGVVKMHCMQEALSLTQSRLSWKQLPVGNNLQALSQK